MEDARPIDVKDVVSDLESGLSDAEIMEKHELTGAKLREVYEKLMDTEIMGLPDLYRRPVLREELTEKHSMRRLPRHYLAFQVPVHVRGESERHGWITNLTEQGVAVQGISAHLHEMVSLEVKLRRLGLGPTIELDAICEWTRDVQADEPPRAGFQIVKISEEDRETLRKFVRFITLE
jgi:hypothetical protein